MKLKQKIAEFLNISGTISHSFQGEDILLWRYFNYANVRDGFFIDIGAYHPKFYNNTWLLRKKLGFRGINIEPMGIELFKRYRKDDINIKCAVGADCGTVKLNVVSAEPMLSGLDGNKIVKPSDKTIEVVQLNLNFIVREFKVKKIDLLDIDIEGSEMEVLRGYDWRIKPRLILIEDDKDKKGEIKDYLTNLGYKQIAHTLNNAIYEYA